MAKKEKRVPAIIFNAGDYAYPKGLRVTDEGELDKKLKSGDWHTGPVDAEKNPIKARQNADQKRAEIAKLQAELAEFDEEDNSDLENELEMSLSTGPTDRANVEKKEKPAPTENKKPLSHMNVSELLEEASIIGLKVDNDWTKTELYNAIKNV